jgi:LPS-assembly protein
MLGAQEEPPAEALPEEPAEAAEEPAPAEPLPEPPDPDRSEFTFQLEDDQGTVTGTTGAVEFRREDYALLTGGVEVHYEDMTLTADQAEIDLETREVTASGNVILDQGPRRLTGDTLVFDLDTKTGTLTEATAFVDPDYYFSGSEISKIGDDLYTVTDGIFTACDQEVPDWSFRLGHARVEVEGYAHVTHARLNVKRLPVFYTPYIVYPTKRERSAGLLVPNFGYSDRRGTYLGMAYFQPIGRSYDTTIYLDGYSEGFVGVGDEFRYHPTEGTIGKLEAYAIRDGDALPEEDEWRWRATLDHVSDDLPLGLRGVIDWTEYSDFQFFRDFERDFDINSRRFEDSLAFLTGNWGTHLLNLQVTDRETVSGDRINTDQRLPALEYRLRSTPLFETPLWEAPLYITVASSLAYLSVDRSDTYQSEYGRADLFPEVSLPIEPAPWLSLSLTAGHRLTWWGDSLETESTAIEETGSSFTGESLTRSISTWGAEVIGPSISRVFDRAAGPFARFKHIVEPRVSYSFVDDYDEDREVPSFDGVDRLFSGNAARVSLINRLKAKPPEEEGGAAREILTFELSQSYSFDDEQPLEEGRELPNDPEAPLLSSQTGPLEATLRFAPSPLTNVRADWRYSTLFNQLLSTSIAGDLRLGLHDLGLRYTTRYRAQDGETLSDQIRVAAGVALLPQRLGLRAALDYDIEESNLQEQRYFLDWTAQCYSIRLEYRDFQVGQTQDTDYRIAFTLKNVGTFLDLTGRVE